MWHDRVSRGVSVLCCIAAPISMFYGNLPKCGNKVKVGNKVTNWCNVWSIKGITVCGRVPECHVTLRRKDFIMFVEILISTIELPERRIQTFPDISLSEELRRKSRRPYNKTFRRGESTNIPSEQWEKTP